VISPLGRGGAIPIGHGDVLIPGLLIGAFGLALFLPLEFMGMLAVYYLITLAYSLWLKGIALADVMVLAGLYVMRIIAAAAAVSVMLSFWLLAFSMFLFLSLALVKRFTELSTMQQQQETVAFGRGYRTTDSETLSQFGSASAYSAVLVLALYINSGAVRDLYTHPEVIWLLCPLLLYMLTRVWLLARRGELDEDPVVFVTLDRYSQWLVGIGAILLWLADRKRCPRQEPPPGRDLRLPCPPLRAPALGRRAAHLRAGRQPGLLQGDHCRTGADRGHYLGRDPIEGHPQSLPGARDYSLRQPR